MTHHHGIHCAWLALGPQVVIFGLTASNGVGVKGLRKLQWEKWDQKVTRYSQIQKPSRAMVTLWRKPSGSSQIHVTCQSFGSILREPDDLRRGRAEL
jgi:hypothetical protein